MVSGKSEIEDVTSDRFIEIFIEIKKYLRGNPTDLEILMDMFPDICPKSFYEDDQIGLLIDMESAAESYKVMPFSQNYMDNPNQVVRGFDIIREVRNRWHQKKMDEIDKNSSKDMPKK